MCGASHTLPEWLSRIIRLKRSNRRLAKPCQPCWSLLLLLLRERVHTISIFFLNNWKDMYSIYLFIYFKGNIFAEKSCTRPSNKKKIDDTELFVLLLSVMVHLQWKKKKHVLNEMKRFLQHSHFNVQHFPGKLLKTNSDESSCTTVMFARTHVSRLIALH